MIVQESAWGMTQAKGARKLQRPLPRPQQDDRISTRNIHRPETRLWSHNIIWPKYTRYLKLLKGKPVTLTDLRIFSQFVGKLAALKTIVTSTLQAIRNYFHKRHSGESSEYLANCNFTNLLVCPTNGYHLTAMLQLKIK